MRGRHEAARLGTDPFIAVVVIVLLALLALVLALSVT